MKPLFNSYNIKQVTVARVFMPDYPWFTPIVITTIKNIFNLIKGRKKKDEVKHLEIITNVRL